uniref:Centromere protein I n=1 Tax=Lygus hesperus TaxID=30085 RepID=A0A0A9XT82_LYGHE
MPATFEDVFGSLGIEERLDDDLKFVEAVKDHLDQAFRKRVDEIWEEGLEPRSFDVLVRIFTDGAELDKMFRCLILDCLVPTEMISDNSAEEMIFWVICNCIEYPDECAEVLRWLSPMVRFNMVNDYILDQKYNALLKRLLYPQLVKGLSEILCLAAKPVFMTKSNIDLLEKLCEDQYNDVYIRTILGEYAKYVPHLVDRKFHFVKPQVWDSGKIPDFDLVIQNMARRAGVESIKQFPTPHILCRGLPSIEYQVRRKDENLKKIGEVKSMVELGRALERLQLPTNELALLQKEEGVMMIIVDGPSHNFLASLSIALSKSPTKTLIAAVSGLQDLLSYGLPPVTPFLSDFLLCWDGRHNEEYVYSLLPKLYFRNFKELKEGIFDHLLRVFVANSAETKMKILDSLLLLITHMIAVDRRRGNVDVCPTITSPKWISESDATIASVIEYVIEMWKQGIILEGPSCTLLVLKSILFYQKLNQLIIQCGLPIFFVIHQSLSCTALLAKNHVILNELCLLILQYKQHLIPLFEQQGLLGEYELEVESVMALADSTYKYLWERVGGERPENFHTTQDEFTPSDSIGLEHLGLYPIVAGIAKELHRNPRQMNKNELMSVLESFISGVAEFIKYEEHDQLRQ